MHHCGSHKLVGVEVVDNRSRGFPKGDRVGFMPTSSTCLDFSDCISGNHRLCEKKTLVGPDGGFSQSCVVDPLSTVRIHDTLPDEIGAPLLFVGVFAYRAPEKVLHFLTDGKARKIIGCDGDGHMVMMYAKAVGYRAHAYDCRRRQAPAGQRLRRRRSLQLHCLGGR